MMKCGWKYIVDINRFRHGCAVMMKYGGKQLSALFILLSFFSLASAQVSIKANIDHDKILIGEPILLSVEAYVPIGVPVVWFSADSIPHFEIIEKSAMDTADGIDGKKISQLISITSFDSGRWQIPSFEVLVSGRPYYSDSLSVDVGFVSFDPSEDYRDIKEIEAVTDPYTKYIPWAIAAATLISLALIIYFIRRKKAPGQVAPEERLRLSPLEEAMQEITALKAKQWEGEEKIYYSKLNDILRVFILRKYGISTLQRTNDELIQQLSRLKMPKEPYIQLAQSLRMCDFVKFAKYHPVKKENQENLEIIWSSIEILDNNIMSGAV